METMAYIFSNGCIEVRFPSLVGIYASNNAVVIVNKIMKSVAIQFAV